MPQWLPRSCSVPWLRVLLAVVGSVVVVTETDHLGAASATTVTAASYLGALEVERHDAGPNARALERILPAIAALTTPNQTKFSVNDTKYFGIWDMNGFDPDYPFDKFDYRNPLSVLRGMRYLNHSWKQVSDDLHRRANFSFCGVVKDLWNCEGDHYFDVLRKLRRFNASVFTRSVRSGSVIMGVGNSYFAELWAPVLCLKSVLLWKFDGTSSNSFAAYWPAKDVLLLLFDNDLLFSWSTHETLGTFLHEQAVKPTVVTIGHENGHRPKRDDLRAKAYQSVVAGTAGLVERFGVEALNTSGCLAAEPSQIKRLGKCNSRSPAHGCYPGPLFAAAEQFWLEVGTKSWTGDDSDDVGANTN